MVHGVKRDNQDVLPSAYELGERVMSNCMKKLKSYMGGLVRSFGASLSQYSKIVASICQRVLMAWSRTMQMLLACYDRR